MACFGVLSMLQLLVLGVLVLSVVVGEGQAREVVIDEVRTATPLDTAAIGAEGRSIVAARLTPAAYSNGLVLALPRL